MLCRSISSTLIYNTDVLLIFLGAKLLYELVYRSLTQSLDFFDFFFKDYLYKNIHNRQNMFFSLWIIFYVKSFQLQCPYLSITLLLSTQFVNEKMFLGDF